MYQPNGYDASELLRDLGTALRGEALAYNPYPRGRPLHAAIDAALAARARLEITQPDGIESVTVEADSAGHNDQFGRGLTKRHPTQVMEAQFAQTFLVATALVHGKVGIAEVDGLGDASVLALADRVAGVARDGRPKGSFSITVKRTDGRLATVEASDPIGSPEKPLTNAQLGAKFRDCARNAVQPLSDASLDRLLAAIGRLKKLADARELMTPSPGDEAVAPPNFWCFVSLRTLFSCPSHRFADRPSTLLALGCPVDRPLRTGATRQAAGAGSAFHHPSRTICSRMRNDGFGSKLRRTSNVAAPPVSLQQRACLRTGRDWGSGRVEDGRGSLGHSASLRFPSPLIEADVRC